MPTSAPESVPVSVREIAWTRCGTRRASVHFAQKIVSAAAPASSGHDQLRVWLLPYLVNVLDRVSSKSATTAHRQDQVAILRRPVALARMGRSPAARQSLVVRIAPAQFHAGTAKLLRWRSRDKNLRHNGCVHQQRLRRIASARRIIRRLRVQDSNRAQPCAQISRCDERTHGKSFAMSGYGILLRRRNRFGTNSSPPRGIQQVHIALQVAAAPSRQRASAADCGRVRPVISVSPPGAALQIDISTSFGARGSLLPALQQNRVSRFQRER